MKRDFYLNQLISKKDNRRVKIITGIRRCGKSFLLFDLYKKYLLKDGVKENEIIALALDNALHAKYRDPLVLSEYIEEKTKDLSKTYYVLLDEIQFVGKKKIQTNPEIVISFYDVLNGLLQKGNLDIYVTGSNSKMLSSDIMTEFRGRGDEIRIYPLSFREYYDTVNASVEKAFSDYMIYGGLPYLSYLDNNKEKRKYLTDLFRETYFKDITECHTITYSDALNLITDELCSSIGSLINSTSLAKTLKSNKNVKIDDETVSSYLGYLTESFLFTKALRYDLKGKKYFSFPIKFYCADTGLNNARLNFRQIEEMHLMENVIFNELRSRGSSVDVGVVDGYEIINGVRKHISREIDFIVNATGEGKKCYIQSALNIDNKDKLEQELRPFTKLSNDFTKRVLITKTSIDPWTDDQGILHLGIYDFLLNKDSLNL
jgi:hypothetical protein